MTIINIEFIKEVSSLLSFILRCDELIKLNEKKSDMVIVNNVNVTPRVAKEIYAAQRIAAVKYLREVYDIDVRRVGGEVQNERN